MKYLTILATILLAACGSGNQPEPGKQSTAATTKPMALPRAITRSSTPLNPDFEQAGDDGEIPGWMTIQHGGPPSYSMTVDSEGAYAGHGSFHMVRTQPQIYGSLEQTLDARPYAGKTVELSAMLKARGVGPEGWKLYISTHLPGVMAHSNGLVGDADWKRDAVRLSIPESVTELSIGVTLLDAGEGWMDDVALKVVN